MKLPNLKRLGILEVTIMNVLVKMWVETEIKPETFKWAIERYSYKLEKYGMKIKKVTTSWTK